MILSDPLQAEAPLSGTWRRLLSESGSWPNKMTASTPSISCTMSSFPNSLVLHDPLNFPRTKNPALLAFRNPRGSIAWRPMIPNESKNWRVSESFGTVKSSRKPIPETESQTIDCVGTGLDVECKIVGDEKKMAIHVEELDTDLLSRALEWAVLVSPFFFWGTAMVAMKEVIPKTGPFFVSAVRLIPSGFLLVGYAIYAERKLPSGFMAWLSIALFGLVDAACFQGFLAEGLQRTSAGLGSVIIDSQPLTVAVLASLLFGETISGFGVFGLVLGVIGLLLLEVPALTFDGSSTVWGSGEWWMLLAAQNMAVGTVMVRWVSKYSDPVMATGWHMIVGGLPLLVLSVLNHDPAISGSFKDLTFNDLLALAYTSVFGSAVSYGVYFYNATKGSLTKFSSLTFLTPMFASIFGYLYLDETLSILQLVGAAVTLVGIYMVNFHPINGTK